MLYLGSQGKTLATSSNYWDSVLIQIETIIPDQICFFPLTLFFELDLEVLAVFTKDPWYHHKLICDFFPLNDSYR